MLLDEPFAGIDPIAIGEIKDNIRKISEDKGLGVLITDHNPKATLSITDRAYVIFDGKIKIQGKSQDVANDPVAKEFYIHSGNVGYFCCHITFYSRVDCS